MYFFSCMAGSCTCDQFDITLSLCSTASDRLYRLMKGRLLLRPLTMSCESVLIHCSQHTSTQLPNYLNVPEFLCGSNILHFCTAVWSFQAIVLCLTCGNVSKAARLGLTNRLFFALQLQQNKLAKTHPVCFIQLG